MMFPGKMTFLLGPLALRMAACKPIRPRLRAQLNEEIIAEHPPKFVVE